MRGLSPRVRGNHALGQPLRLSTGLSPRVRGNPVSCVGNRVRGKPGEAYLPMVYPRACGGTVAPGPNARSSGVYPRACGGTMAQWSAAYRGSIPARAGEPFISRQTGRARVYPRACGGTAGASPKPKRSIPARAGEPQGSTAIGLSPRVRGNPWRASV